MSLEYKEVKIIERSIAEHLSVNTMKDKEKEILEVGMLKSLLTLGLKKTRKAFGDREFILNLIKGGVMDKEGIFYVTHEDLEHEYIWFVMTLLVGKGLIKREGVQS